MTGQEGQMRTSADGALLEAALTELEQVVGDAAFVAELIDEFLAGLPTQRAALRAAMAADDTEQVHRLAHTLKSNAATFGGVAFAEACRELELAAQGGLPIDAALVRRVEDEAVQLTPRLAAARDLRGS
jgi:HPt (histidine-containing phosphotransfer) domain-containing protein